MKGYPLDLDEDKGTKVNGLKPELDQNLKQSFFPVWPFRPWLGYGQGFGIFAGQ